MKHNRLKQFFQDFYLALILLFLYIPIVTMIVLSFNNTKSRTVWGGFTTRWYTQMFQDSAIMNALNNTLLIAFASALIATVIGTIAAIGIHNMEYRRQRQMCIRDSRYRNRYLPDAGIYRVRYLSRI